MAAKDDILKSLRSHPIPPVALPDMNRAWITYPDRKAKFAESLKFVGGRCVFVERIDQIDAALAEIGEYVAATRIVSIIPGVGRPNVDLKTVADAHILETVDFAILPGEFGVAENGAVWCTDRNIEHRAIFFIPQHLALVIPSGVLVDTMHQAYERLTFSGPGFGAFISGPSKTADIEQSLVIGAHGPRSLTVFCVG